MSDYNNWPRKRFEELPARSWNEDIGEFDSLIILPMRQRHDSGYRCMDFVAVKDNEPFCRLSGCSDVIHIDGIGGYGHNWLDTYSGVPHLVPPSGWNIDCLPVSGLLRMWSRGKMTRRSEGGHRMTDYRALHEAEGSNQWYQHDSLVVCAPTGNVIACCTDRRAALIVALRNGYANGELVERSKILEAIGARPDTDLTIVELFDSRCDEAYQAGRFLERSDIEQRVERLVGAIDDEYGFSPRMSADLREMPNEIAQRLEDWLAGIRTALKEVRS